MGKTLMGIAQQLRDADKKVQLIYAFNGAGKTRLSREFKELIAPKVEEDEDAENRVKVLYYNAFTEDLFYWDNDLDGDAERKLKIQPNKYTQWVLHEQGQDQNAITHFQHYTSNKLTPRFNENFSEVTFSFERGNEGRSEHIKISKGEESNFIWSIFYSLIEQVIDVLNVAEPSERETDQFDQLKYIFIDDPVSSLDENHLIELAVHVAELIKLSDYTDGQGLKFIVTTHNPLFYNILSNEFNSDDKSVNWKSKYFVKYRLVKKEDGFFDIEPQPNDSPFSYHLFLKTELKKAVDTGEIRKYHFNFLRNILEKTSTFVGFKRWEELLPGNESGRDNPYMKRIMNLSSHSKHSGEEVAEPQEEDKRVFRFLVQKLDEMYQLKMRAE
jgi:wobble nucleotide-excising tRNase